MTRIVYAKKDLEGIRTTFDVSRVFSPDDEKRFMKIEEKEDTPKKREVGAGGGHNNGGAARGGADSGSISNLAHMNHSENNGVGGSVFHNNHISSNSDGGTFGNHNNTHHHSNNHNSRGGGDGSHNRLDRRDHRRQFNDRFSVGQRAPRGANRDEEAFEAGYNYELKMNEAQRRELQAAMEKEAKKHQQVHREEDHGPSGFAMETEQKSKETDEMEHLLASLANQQFPSQTVGTQPTKKSRFFQSGASASDGTEHHGGNTKKEDSIWGTYSSSTSTGHVASAGGAATTLDNRESGGNVGTSTPSSTLDVGHRSDPNAMTISQFMRGEQTNASVVSEARGGATNLPSSFYQRGAGASIQYSATQEGRDGAIKIPPSGPTNQLDQLFLSVTAGAQRSQASPTGGTAELSQGGNRFSSAASASTSSNGGAGMNVDGMRPTAPTGQVWTAQDVERLLNQQWARGGVSQQAGELAVPMEGKAISASELESRLIQQAQRQNGRNSTMHGTLSGGNTVHSYTESGGGTRGSTSSLNSPLSSSSAPAATASSLTGSPPAAAVQAKPTGSTSVNGNATGGFTFSALNASQGVPSPQQQQQAAAAASRYVQQPPQTAQWNQIRFSSGANMNKMPAAPGGGVAQNGNKLPAGSAASWNSSSSYVPYGYAPSTGGNGVMYQNPQQPLMFVTRSIPPFSTSANPNQYQMLSQSQQPGHPQQHPGQQQ